MLKRMTAVFMTVLMLMTALTAAAETPNAFADEKEAEAFIQTLFGEHPETLDGQVPLTAQMLQAISMYGGWKGMALSLTSALGTPVRIGPAYAGVLQGYQTWYVPCEMTALSVDLLLVTEQGTLAGISTGPYTGLPEENDCAFESVSLDVPVPALKGQLPGTLTLPEGDGPFPAVILVHGSGPNDRDETLMNLKPFRDLAEALPAYGIAVYRYDKRTYTYSRETARDTRMTLMEETVKDAVSAAEMLARQEQIDPDRIFLLGHSLGGTAIPAIAEALEGTAVRAGGYILMAASPRPLQELMREQYDFLYALSPELTAEQQAEKDWIYSELDRFEDLDALSDSDSILGVSLPYWRWLAAYDMIAASEQITVPCLILQGEEDYQVSMKDFELLRECLGNRADRHFISYPGLTHALTAGLKSEASTAYLRNEQVDRQVIQDIADFILAK